MSTKGNHKGWPRKSGSVRQRRNSRLMTKEQIQRQHEGVARLNRYFFGGIS